LGLGKQTEAASLGITLGSVAGGLLFNAAALPGASFVLTALLAVLGFVLKPEASSFAGALQSRGQRIYERGALTAEPS
jgi:predicted MFS family arabinose efflux permease